MDAQVKAKWLEALRNGRYEQCIGVLRAEGGLRTSSFCCLGVLCDTLGVVWQGDFARLDGRRLDADGVLLNSHALHLVGFDLDHATELAEMNDNGLKFPEIADYIEKNL